MKPQLSARHYLLAGGLAVAIAASVWAAQWSADDADLALPQASSVRRPTTDSAPSKQAHSAPVQFELLSWEAPKREPWAPIESVAAWSPPPPPPPPPPPVAVVTSPAPPPAPVAPSFPYQLIGRLDSGGVSQALMSGDYRSLSVKAGDVIDGQWRIDRVNANSVSMTWLPAKLPQTIQFRPL